MNKDKIINKILEQYYIIDIVVFSIIIIGVL